MWSLHCAGQLVLGRGRPWSAVETPSGIPLEKRDFPLPRRYQMLVVSWFEVRLWVHIPFPVMGFCLIQGTVGLVHSSTVSVSSCVCQSCCVKKTLFLWNHPPPLGLIVFPPPLLHTSLILRVSTGWRHPIFGWVLTSLSLCPGVKLFFIGF